MCNYNYIVTKKFTHWFRLIICTNLWLEKTFTNRDNMTCSYNISLLYSYFARFVFLNFKITIFYNLLLIRTVLFCNYVNLSDPVISTKIVNWCRKWTLTQRRLCLNIMAAINRKMLLEWTIVFFLTINTLFYYWAVNSAIFFLSNEIDNFYFSILN